MQDPDEAHLRTFVDRGRKAQRAVDKLTGRGKSILLPKVRAKALAEAEDHRALLIEAVRYARRELRHLAGDAEAERRVNRVMRRLDLAITKVDRRRR